MLGGTLKTKEMADKESLEANWFSWEEIKRRSVNRADGELLR